VQDQAVPVQDQYSVAPAQDVHLDIIPTSSLQSTFVLDRVREFLVCDPQIRLVYRWFRQALAAVPLLQLQVEDYFSTLSLFLWARQELHMPTYMRWVQKVVGKAALGGHIVTVTIEFPAKM
jgi:hypothetical protein